MTGAKEKREKLREAIRELTRPINGQYPRPWMVEGNPAEAEVFLVGKNQKNQFTPSDILTPSDIPTHDESTHDESTHDEFLDAHFNCGTPNKCRALYDKVARKRRRGRPSPTRKNIDRLRDCLKGEGVTKVLETNVICYSTSMSADLRRPEHSGGQLRGSEIFRAVLDGVRPKALVVFGAGAAEKLGKTLGASLPAPIHHPEFKACPTLLQVEWGQIGVLVIPSLAPPEWYKWYSQADAAFPVIARTVAEMLRGRTASD